MTAWVSSCCRAAMTTAGGDGTPGSPCWTVCRACSKETDPVEVSRDRHCVVHGVDALVVGATLRMCACPLVASDEGEENER